MITIRRGLDLPINGSPEQVIVDAPPVKSVAVMGPDYHDMKPTMAVAEGDNVVLGQLLFTDKKTEGVRYTAPATGKVSAINRGARRVLQSVVIDVADESEQSQAGITFAKYTAADIANLDSDNIKETLIASGSWVAFRTRPYSKVPEITSSPASIFVTAMDTHPLAADPALVIAADNDAFNTGLLLLTRLTRGDVFVCKAPQADFTVIDQPGIRVENFSGMHPAGNAGTHIHYLDPVSVDKTVWTIGYQDVIAIGHLFVTGSLFVQRIVALGGPSVHNPRLLKTRLGANLQDLCADSLSDNNNRVISGSVFGGRAAHGALGYLGRYHQQITVLAEGNQRPLLHYLRAGVDAFSTLGIYVSSLMKGKTFDFNTSTNGSERAMVPIGVYENMMPLDILPTQLLRALIVGDTDMAQKLGCLELDEEDLALCTFVCPGKYEYGPILRQNLTRIEREG